MNNQEKIPTGAKLIGWGILAFFLLIIIIVAWPLAGVGAGERGVVFNNISGVEPRILGEGTHFRIPFVESVIVIPVKTLATNFEENAGTQDSQSIDVKVTVNWHLDPAQVNKVYQQIGNQDAVESTVLRNNTQDSVKASVSKYQALDIQKNRDTVATRAQDLLQKKVTRYHVIIDNLSLTNVNFSSDFNAAVEQAQVAQQKAKQAEYDVQRVKNEAQSAIAQAQGQAEAQKEVQQSLTPQLLQKMAIEKWNGVLPPQYGSAPLPFLNIGQ